MTPLNIWQQLSNILNDIYLFELLIKTLYAAAHTKQISYEWYESKNIGTQTEQDYMAYKQWDYERGESIIAETYSKDGVHNRKIDQFSNVQGIHEILCEYIVAFSNAFFWPKINPENDTTELLMERVHFISFLVFQFDWIFAQGSVN